MGKPAPLIRYRVGNGYVESLGTSLWIGIDPTDSYGGGGVEFANEAEAATIMLSLGKALLDHIGDSAVSKKVLLEAGLLEGSSNVTLHNVSNEMEVKQCDVTLTDRQTEDENGEINPAHC